MIAFAFNYILITFFIAAVYTAVNGQDLKDTNISTVGSAVVNNWKAGHAFAFNWVRGRFNA